MTKYFDNEFQSASGYWHCMNSSDLGNGSNIWWKFPRSINISLEEYVKVLALNFHATLKYLEKSDTLLFSWKSQSDMRKFKNWANRKYRECN